MALSRAVYTADGVNKQFDITFDYLTADHVQVTVYDADGLSNPIPVAFSFISPTRVQLNDAPLAGKKVRVWRDVPVDSPYVDFVDGAELTERNLDNNSIAVLQVAQRAIDDSEDAVSAASQMAQSAVAAAANAAAAASSAQAAQTYESAAANHMESAWDAAAAAGTSASAAAGSVGALAASSASSLFGHIASGTGAVATTVQKKLREVVSVKDFGAKGDGIADDTAAIQAAIDYIRANIATVNAVLKRAITLHFPDGTYRITSTLNMSAIRAHSWEISGFGAALLGETNGTPVVDMIWSRYFMWSGLSIVGSTTNTPNFGIIIGRPFTGANSDSGEYQFDHCTFYGSFTRACLYTLAPEVVQYNHVRFWNRHSSFDSYCLIVDTNNNENITSAFQSITYPVNTSQSCNENTFLTCDFRKDISGDCILYRGRGVARHNYINSYAATMDGSAVVLKEAVSYNLLQLDMHVETTGAKRILLIDNETSIANIGIKGLRVRDHQPQCSESLIDVTGTTRTVLFDDVEIDCGTPASAIPVFGATAGASSKLLVAGKITWRSPLQCSLANCHFVGDLFVPETTALITHTSGSYRVLTRPDSANGRTVKHKGTQRFIGTATGLLGNEADANYLDVAGGMPGSTPIIQAGGVSTDVGVVVRAKGSGAVDLQSGDGTNKVRVNNTGVGFQGTNPIAKPPITGSRGGNAALASLLTQLANYGLITDSTTA